MVRRLGFFFMNLCSILVPAMRNKQKNQFGISNISDIVFENCMLFTSYESLEVCEQRHHLKRLDRYSDMCFKKSHNPIYSTNL